VRLLLDTNVLIAAFISHGVCAELLEHASKRHTLLWSRPLLTEFRNTLIRKFKIPTLLAAEAAGLVAMESLEVVPAALDKKVCRDPSDDVVLGTALAGEADAIVTGDGDLLVLKRYGSIKIVSPRDFWKFEAESD
jgi:uncharacterized protein